MSTLSDQTTFKNIIIIIVFSVLAASMLYFLSTKYLNRIIQSYNSENFPVVQGEVLEMERKGRGWLGGSDKPTFKRLEIQFNWKGTEYIAKNLGFYFTWNKFQKAEKTGTCEVYVNKNNPHLSLLTEAQDFFCKMLKLFFDQLLVIINQKRMFWLYL